MTQKIAVVGMGGVFPDAPDLDQFWKNILAKRVSIDHGSHLDREVFLRPALPGRGDTQDKTYTDLASRVGSIAFEPARFRIPPRVARHMDDNQKVALLAAEQAMASGALRSVSNERVAVVVGNSGYGALYHEFKLRFDFDRFSHHLREHPTFRRALRPEEAERVLGELRAALLNDTVPVTEDSAPGVLPNVIAARLCSVFDYHGPAFVVDAACASGLAALICGAQQLESGTADAVICGAVDMVIGEQGPILFSALGALSAEGSFPFDERASGFIIGQGGGAVILKRLDDALANHDPVFAVITGYAQGSDGKGKAVAAPNEVWQAKIIQRACEMAGYPVETIGLIEAHGTATQVGDASEVAALKKAFGALGAARTGFCGIGSVKGNIGHLKSAAGIAGFVKATLAVQHGVLPPSAGFVRENPQLALGDSPFYVITEARPWASDGHPRRAGVSAFGFGGVDCHVALEEFRPSDHVASRQRGAPVHAAASPKPSTASSGPLGLPVFFAGDTIDEVLAAAERLARDPGDDLERGLFVHSYAQDARRPVRLAFSVESKAELREHVSLVVSAARSPERLPQLAGRGIYVRHSAPVSADQLAFLFPGQGSQYADMALALCRRSSAAASALARVDAEWTRLTGTSIVSLLDSSAVGRERTEATLRDTRNTHPALAAGSLAVLAVLDELKLTPTVMVGHSAGEIIALIAAGRLSLRDGLALLAARSRAFDHVEGESRGAMAALGVDDARAAELIARAALPLTIANRNGPMQTIVSSDEAGVTRLLELCSSAGVKATRLNVSHAFHSPAMAPAAAAFAVALAQARVSARGTRVIANEANEYYGDDPECVRRQLETQITGPVNFRRSIERLYDDGIRVFVEVGPGTVLTSLTRSILEGKNATVLATDNRGGDPVSALQRALCGLFAAGLNMELVPPRSARPVPELRPTVDSAPHAPELAPRSTGTSSAPAPAARERIVYGGVAVGLPGSFKDCFRDDNFEQLFEGRSLIERLTDAERQRLVDLRVSKLVKSEQGASFVVLQSMNEVIQLAGKLGRVDLLRDYCLDEKDVRTMSNAVAVAVAAGYEALRDAQIPLVHEYARTGTGHVLPERWALPQEMQTETGVIFANGFPLCDPVIAEVSRHLSYKLGHKLRDELFAFYDSLIGRVTHDESRRLLGDWFALNYSRLSDHPGAEEVYTFNHQFMTQIACQANNRLAQLINARGVNFQLNAACSSAATAITLAEDMIREGRLRRVIVIGGDDPASLHSLPYLGAGFLATGACSTEGDPYEAAVPFDRRRNGMVMGAGAVGIVVEAESECHKRGVVPVCEVLGTHTFNTAGHHSQLDVPRYAEELERFIGRVETQHGLDRGRLAEQLLYMSHEPYTPARGGCSESEAVSLRHAFGEKFVHIEVSNTKGMTGHTMGASIEDAVAAKALQYGKAPPVVHHREPDPTLAGLRLFAGGAHDRTFALRMAAGFGSQGNFILLQKVASGDVRVADAELHQRWLASVAQTASPELATRGRTLVVKDSRPGAVITERPTLSPGCRVSSAPPGGAELRPSQVGRPSRGAQTSVPPPVAHAVARPSEPAPPPFGTAHSERPAPVSAPADARAEVLGLIAEVTGYSADMLQPDMELEADLGVDTVKQATILARLAERFGAAADEGFRVSDFPDIRSIMDWFSSGPLARSSEIARAPAPVVGDLRAAVDDTPERAVVAGGPRVAASPSIASRVLDIVAEVTGYSAEMLAEDMELEADLGVDTVKQATIIARLGEMLGRIPDAGFRVADFPSIGHLVTFAGEGATAAVGERQLAEIRPPLRSPSVALPSPPAVPESSQRREGTSEPSGAGSVERRLVATVSELTAYPPEMLVSELRVRDDLALGDDVLEQIRGRLVQGFALAPEWNFAQDASLGDIVRSISASVAAGTNDRGAGDPPIDLARQVLALRPAPLTAAGGAPGIKARSLWVIGDQAGIVSALRRALEGTADECAGLVVPASGCAEVISALSRFSGDSAPEVIVDTTACGCSGDLHAMSAHDAAALVERAADARFAIYRYLTDRQRTPRRILAVTGTGGAFGLGGDGADGLQSVFGLYRGFYKALRKEWPSAMVSVLDVAPAELVERTMAELAGTGPGVEVCYQGGIRQAVALDDCTDVAGDDALAFTMSDVLVATGGGAGITSLVLRELARRGPTRFVLTGRTPLPEDVSRLAAMDERALLAEKEVIRRRLSTAGGRVTPVMVEREHATLLRTVEIHRTLEALRAAGCEVRYHAVDVRDAARMQSVLEQTRAAWGPITGLLHGAGIEISHPIATKTADEFRAVHSIKTLGAVNLGRLCQTDPLRVVVAFSSISGRFGSAGQLDYSAANGFLDGWAADVGRRRGIRGISLVWSGWEGAGMAWRSSFVRDQGERLGLNLIDPDSGSRAAVREICAASGPTEVVLHRGLGEMLEPGMAIVDLSSLPFIDRVDRFDGAIHAVHRRFSPRRDVFLDQHRFGGAPLMPGVALMEMMVEARTLLEGAAAGAQVFRRLEFSDALRFYREQGRDVTIAIARCETAPGTYRMLVTSPFRTAVAAAPEPRQYSSAEVSVEAPDVEWLREHSWDLGAVKHASYRALVSTAPDLPQSVSLGPLFNEVQDEAADAADVEVSWSEQGICTPVRLPRAQLQAPGYPLERFLINPAFLDAMHQAGAVCGILLTGDVHLPCGADEFAVLRAPKQAGRYRVIAKLRQREADRLLYDIGMWNESGEVCAYAKGSMFRRVRQ